MMIPRPVSRLDRVAVGRKYVELALINRSLLVIECSNMTHPGLSLRVPCGLQARHLSGPHRGKLHRKAPKYLRVGEKGTGRD